MTREEVQAMIADAIQDCVMIGMKIALQASGEVTEGKILSMDGGGPPTNNEEFVIVSRDVDKIGPWESLKVHRGK